MKRSASASASAMEGMEALHRETYQVPALRPSLGQRQGRGRRWPQAPSGQLEYKVSVSEWLLNSTSVAYLLSDRDYDAHIPLFIEAHANQYTGGRIKTMNRNPETVKEAADRRQANKARGSADPTQPTPTGTGSPQGEGATSSRTRTTSWWQSKRWQRRQVLQGQRQRQRKELTRF